MFFDLTDRNEDRSCPRSFPTQFWEMTALYFQACWSAKPQAVLLREPRRIPAGPHPGTRPDVAHPTRTCLGFSISPKQLALRH